MKLIRFAPGEEGGGAGAVVEIPDDTVVVDSELAHLAEMEKSLLGKTDLDVEVKDKLGKHLKVTPVEKTSAKKETEEVEGGDSDDEDDSKKKPPAKKEAKAEGAAAKEEDGGEEEEKKEVKGKALPFMKKVVSTPGTTKPLFDETIDKSVTEYLQKNFGKEIKDPKTFFEKSVNAWRDDSQKLPHVQEQLNKLSGAIDDLPEFFQKAMVAYKKDEDWQSVLSNGMNEGIDFKKPLDKQLNRVAKVLMPEANLTDISEEDYVDLKNEDSVKTKKFMTTLKRVFEERKELWNKDNQTQAEKNKTQMEKATGVVKKSVKSLTEMLPEDFEKRDAHLKGVKQIMNNGEFDSIFFDDDGTPHEDVAERVYFAKFGPELVASYIEEIDRLQGMLNDMAASGTDKKASKTSNKRTVAVAADGTDLVDVYEKSQSNGKAGKSRYDPPSRDN